MQKDLIYLTYHQVMIFMYRIEEMKKENTEMDDEFLQNFEEYVIKRAGEIVMIYPPILAYLKKGANKYILQPETFEYLCLKTGVNPCLKSTQEEYKPLIATVEKEAQEKFANQIKTLN